MIGEAWVPDVTRAILSLQTGAGIKDVIGRLAAGISLTEDQLAPVYPLKRAEEAEKEQLLAASIAAGEPAPPGR